MFLKSSTIKSKFLLCIVVLLMAPMSHAQLSDLARIEYSFIPFRKTDDDYTRFRGILNVPLKLKDETYLVVGAEYNLITLDLEDNYPFEVDLLKRIHVIDLNLGYTFKMNERWRFGAKLGPRVASTLNERITSDDIFVIGGVYFVNDRPESESRKPYRLILGLSYNSTVGVPFPLPVISYQRQINEKWSFAIGVPKTNLKYAINQSNIFQTFATLDGYFANIQKPIMVNNEQVDSISLSLIITGLGFEHLFTKNIVAYIYTGYTISLKNDLDNIDRNSVFKLSDVNTFYLRTGFKYKI